MRVLLVDDEPGVRLLVGKRLTRCGWQVDKVLDGEEALDASHRVDYDAIVLDQRLPGRSGLEVVEELDHDVPVVLFTAHLDDTVRAAAHDAGCHVVDKTDLDRLVAVIEDVAGAH
jgi:DNA-binding response OmpR family regulator